MGATTTGRISYLPGEQTGAAATPEAAARPEEMAKLAAAAAVGPILKRWRHRCADGLIDESGKIRNVFTRAQSGAEDNVSRVIRTLNQIPEAIAEFEVALAAQTKLNELTRHSVEVPIRDARTMTDPGLDGPGFQLEHHVSKVTDWQDDGQLASIYYPEIEALVRRVTGATHAFSNNHLRRQSEPETGGDGPLAKLMAQSRGPVLTAHNDFAESFGEGLIRTVGSEGLPHTQTFGLTDAMLAAGITEEELRSRRLIVVNTWRSVGPEPLRRYPLAVADRRSVNRSCLSRNLIGRVPSGQPRGGIEIYSARYEAGHQWYY